MQKTIIGLILFISPLFLLAHNPLSAVYRLENNNNRGVLTINLTQSGVNKTLKSIHGTEYLSTITEDKLKEVIVDYIKSNFKFKVNNSEIKLKNGGIRLGNHQTNLTFITSNIPKEIDNIDIEITSFKNNEYHNSVFYFNKGSKREKVILNTKNNFKFHINFNENQVSSNSIFFFTTKNIYQTSFIVVLILVLALFMVFKVLKRRNS